jgi:hypothetical protein
MNLTSWQALGYDTHSQIVLPENQLFVDNTNGNFHLLPSSQPINIGTSLVNTVVSFDIEGVSRPQGSGYDIGAYEYSSTTSTDDEKVVDGFRLYQNYPNPFNPSTKISWYSPVSSWQTLKIYDVLGNEVATLVDEHRPEGMNSAQFTTNNKLSSGIYFYKLTTSSIVETMKMILMK